VLQYFDLDLHERTVLLHFSETVSSPSIDLRKLQFQSENSGGSKHSLTPGEGSKYSYVESSSDHIVVHLGTIDFNEIQRLITLAVDDESTFLSLTSDALVDMNGVNVTEIPWGNALSVQEHTRDFEVAHFVQFNLNLTMNRLTLTFAETVDASTLQVGEITLQSM
jgi:hypothetical protein